MGVYGNTILSEAHTPYKNILETIDGQLLVGDPDSAVTRGKVLIAALPTRTLWKNISKKMILSFSATAMNPSYVPLR